MWLHQNGMWELLDEFGVTLEPEASADSEKPSQPDSCAVAYGDEAVGNERGDRCCAVVIVASSAKTDIWLAREGHLVQKSDADP